MNKGAIYFFNEDIPVFTLKKNSVKSWLRSAVHTEGFNIAYLNFIFCSDTYLLKVNQDYLSHSYYTDIITFNQSEKPFSLEAEIYISIDRVKYNSELLNLPFETELLRVIIHGALHLMGYNDKLQEQIALMRVKETFYIEKYYLK